MWHCVNWYIVNSKRQIFNVYVVQLDTQCSFYGWVYSQYLLALQCFRPQGSIFRSVFQSCMSGLVCANTCTALCFRPLAVQCFGPQGSIFRSDFQSSMLPAVTARSIKQYVYYHIPICSCSFERHSWRWTYEVQNTVELIHIVNKLDHKRTLCI
jgi:hypothetical protein